MSQTLYEEAIAEARRLTEMAEQNAKNKIIDAVTPRIKRLIEQELMNPEGDEDSDLEDEDQEEMEAGDDMPTGAPPAIDLDSLSPQAAGAAIPAASPQKLVNNFEVNDDEIKISAGGLDIKIERSDDEDANLPAGVEESLSRMVAGSPTARRKMRNKLTSLEGKVRVLKTALTEAKQSGTVAQKRRIAGIFEQLAKEAVTLRSQAILTERITGGRTLETNIANSIIKEMRDMSRRNNRSVFDFLFEAEDDKTVEKDEKDTVPMGGSDEEGNDDPLDMSDTGDEEETESEAEEGDMDVDLPALEDALEQVAAALGKKLTDADDESPKTEGQYHEGGLYEEETGDDVGGEGLDEYGSPTTEMHGMKEGRVYEINESELRRELNRLRRINEADAVSGSGASSFGGGKAGDDMFVDVDEETLLNALADELGDAPKPKVGGAQLAKESFARRSALAEASQLRRQVADYRSVAEQLKGQLVEMNLFNAKLLYANKLMQNRDLSAKQQRAIVEALDNAKTLREAKLLYKSLTESLNRSTNRGGLTEGARVLGSSSKSARSAQPNLLAEGSAGGTDRWAVLAGIKKD